MNGLCRFVLPAKIVVQDQYRDLDDRVAKRNRDWQGTENWIKDTDRCDLYRPDGKTYIVQRRIGA